MKCEDVMVSVVMPAYNAGLYIGAAIQSILNQTLANFELIILDDASNDQTFAIANSFAVRDKRITVFRNEINVGIAGNRNLGVSLAKGKYLAWQDADDLSLPTRLEKQYQFLESNVDVGIVGASIELFSEENRRLGVRHYHAQDHGLRKSIFRFSPVAQPVAMIRKEILDVVGLYDIELPPAEDLDMSFRIGKIAKLANLSEILLKYRVSPGSATWKTLRTMEVNTLKIRKKYMFSGGYDVGVLDIAYNLLHVISVYLVPRAVKLRLFSLIRDSKA